MKLLILIVALGFTTLAQGQTKQAVDDIMSNNIHLGVDLQTKYVWRGMEMMTENSSPVVFPTISYSNNGLSMYVMGGYALNGQYAEVDLGISYSWNWMTLGVNDYYYPTVSSNKDDYFHFGTNTGHWVEGVVTISPERIPAYLTLSTFFYGADKMPDGKQAYSSYLELGVYHDFVDNNRLSFAIGAACNKSCYNGYANELGICNLELKYTNNVALNSELVIPLHVAYIINPIYKKSFVNLSTSVYF